MVHRVQNRTADGYFSGLDLHCITVILGKVKGFFSLSRIFAVLLGSLIGTFGVYSLVLIASLAHNAYEEVVKPTLQQEAKGPTQPGDCQPHQYIQTDPQAFGITKQMETSKRLSGTLYEP